MNKESNQAEDREIAAASESLPSKTRFLSGGASRAKLIQAAAANHTEWFIGNAIALNGEVNETNGVIWTATVREVTIAFPRLDAETAGETLDTIVAECFRRKVEKASCWSLSPTRPRDLGARLAARGFEWGWRPHWMALDLHTLPDDFSLPEGLHITIENSESEWDVDDLPYYRREDAAFRHALAHAQPRRAWHFGAWLNGKIVGQSTVYVTTGRLGIAGIYDVGVVPSARHQGIGSAVSLAACQFARMLGCRYALLNSAADALYKRLGFGSLGYGQTWWIHSATLVAPPPTAAQIRFAEAIGRGDTATLDTLLPSDLPADLDAPLPNGTTPMQLAVQSRQPRSAEWLAAHAATLDILTAWDLGWKARARRLLIASPELANRRAGNWQTTPLHEAIARDDLPLVRLLLRAALDLEIQDTEFHSTPLGWARHFGRTEIIALLAEEKGSKALTAMVLGEPREAIRL